MDTSCGDKPGFFLSALPDREQSLRLDGARKCSFNHYLTLFDGLIVHWRHRDPRTFFKLAVAWSASSSALWRAG